MPGGRRPRTCNSLYTRTTQEAEAEADVRSHPARRSRGRPRRAVQSSAVPPPEEDRTTTTDDEDQQLAPQTGGGDTSSGGVAGGSTSSTSSVPYLRGSSQLPARPIPFQRRPVIRPKGDK